MQVDRPRPRWKGWIGGQQCRTISAAIVRHGCRARAEDGRRAACAWPSRNSTRLDRLADPRRMAICCRCSGGYAAQVTGQPEITRDNLKRMVAVTGRISGRSIGSG